MKMPEYQELSCKKYLNTSFSYSVQTTSFSVFSFLYVDHLAMHYTFPTGGTEKAIHLYYRMECMRLSDLGGSSANPAREAARRTE